MLDVGKLYGYIMTSLGQALARDASRYRGALTNHAATVALGSILALSAQATELATLLDGAPPTVLIAATTTVSKDTVVPATTTLKFERGGRLEVAVGATLRLDGGIDAGAYQIFTGGGRVSGDAKIDVVRPEWYLDGTYDDETCDWSAAINQAIEFANGNCRTVLFAPRVYNVNRTVDLSSSPQNTRAGMKLAGSVRSTQYEHGTALLGNTGPGQAILETTDSDGIHVVNLALRAGKKTPSTIGLLQARGTGTGWAGDHYYENLYVNMGSNPDANANCGTIGVVNLAGEETRYHNLQVWANLPVVFTWTAAFMVTNPALDRTQRSLTLRSSVGRELATNASNTVFAFSGLGRLIALDYVSPCVLLAVGATIDLGHTFMQQRASGTPGVAVGAYGYAIENWNCYQFRHFGSLEGFSSYLLCRRGLTGADINVRLGGTGEKDKPLIQLYDDGGKYRLDTIDMVFFSYDEKRPLLDCKGFNGAGGFTVERCQFRGNLTQINGIEVRP